jgi:hypothetical protein
MGARFSTPGASFDQHIRHLITVFNHSCPPPVLPLAALTEASVNTNVSVLPIQQQHTLKLQLWLVGLSWSAVRLACSKVSTEICNMHMFCYGLLLLCFCCLPCRSTYHLVSSSCSSQMMKTIKRTSSCLYSRATLVCDMSWSVYGQDKLCTAILCVVLVRCDTMAIYQGLQHLMGYTVS